MKLKNTLGIAIGSFVAATSFGALAQGQGAVEGELFYKKQYNDSVNHVEDGYNPGASIGYFITDDVSLNLTYDKTNHTRSNDGTGHQKIKGDNFGLNAQYHFRDVGDALRPYVSGGVAHKSMTNVEADGHSGRDKSTFLTAGAGVKWYITNNIFARAGIEADYKLDNGKWDYAPTVGLGVNFGGNGSVFQGYYNLLSSDFLHPIGESAPSNYQRYSNPEVDALLTEFRTSVDETRQKEIAGELQEVMYNDVPIVSVYYAGLWGLVSNKSFTGWPSAENPYMTPTPYTSSALVVLTTITKVDS